MQQQCLENVGIQQIHYYEPTQKHVFEGPKMQAVMKVNVWLKSHSFRQRPISKCIRVTCKPSSPPSPSAATPTTVAPSETVPVPVPVALSVMFACAVLVPAVGLAVSTIIWRAWTCPRIFVNLHLHMAWFCTGLCGGETRRARRLVVSGNTLARVGIVGFCGRKRNIGTGG